MDRSLPDGYFTEGEGRKVVCAPDDGLILPPLAPSDVGCWQCSRVGIRAVVCDLQTWVFGSLVKVRRG